MSGFTIKNFDAIDNVAPGGLELLAIGSDRPEGGDRVAAKDRWTD